MGLLKRYFTSPETIAREILQEGKQHEQALRKYVDALPQKRDVIILLSIDNYAQQLPLLKRLIETELVELGDAETIEEQLLANLKDFRFEKEIERVGRLEACLGYVEMKEEHVHYFLVHLFHTLRLELGVVILLERSATRTPVGQEPVREHIQKLQDLWKVEKGLVDQMSSRDAGGNRVFVDASSFKQSVVDIFSKLVRGEHVIHAMNQNMRSLVKQLIPKMRDGGSLAAFVGAIFAAIEDHIGELVASDQDLYHFNIYFDVVNRPDFIDIVRKKNMEHGSPLQEDELSAFVLIFRNWYNKQNLGADH